MAIPFNVVRILRDPICPLIIVSGDTAAIDLGEQLWGESELVVLARKRQGFDLTDREQSGQIILAVAGADMLNQAFLFRGGVGGFFVPDFYGLIELGEVIRCPFFETEPFGVVCRGKSGQLVGTGPRPARVSGNCPGHGSGHQSRW